MTKLKLYLAHFTFEAIDPIGIRIIGVVFHLLAQNPRKLIVHAVCLSRMNSAAIGPDESLMNVFEESERHSPCTKNIKN